jgi:hypothetical protein
VGGAQLCAGVGAAALAAQPFAVEQMGAGQRQPRAQLLRPAKASSISGSTPAARTT